MEDEKEGRNRRKTMERWLPVYTLADFDMDEGLSDTDGESFELDFSDEARMRRLSHRAGVRDGS